LLTDSGETGENEVYWLQDLHFEGPNLDVPSPPLDLPWEQREDWRSIKLLAINGIPATEEALIKALQTQGNVLLSAAAHASGSSMAKRAIPLLRKVARGPDDYAAVEAAYALTRLGDAGGEMLLREALQRPVGAYLSPVLAAGYLAQLGDPSGCVVVGTALGSDLSAIRMLACKQLVFFLPFQGQGQVPGAGTFALFEQALRDHDGTVQGEVLAQLQSLRSAETKPLLENYIDQAHDPSLRDVAQGILDDLEAS
jgi:HEAT repeat protein